MGPALALLGTNPRLSTRPLTSVVAGVPLVAYRSARLTFRRDAIEALPAHGVVLIEVQPRDGREPFAVAMTRSDFERAFPNVVSSGSWTSRGIYDCNSMPDRALPFVVRGSPSGGRLGTASPKRDPESASAERVQSEPLDPVVAAWVRGVAGEAGARAESDEYLRLVRDWAAPWRPKSVRAVLVVDTLPPEEEGDVRVEVSLGALGKLVPGPLPTGFCRSPYCLGAGENELCSVMPWANHGMPHLWRVLGAIARGVQATVPRFSTSDLAPRLKWKLEVLRELRDRGVWLVPASPTAAVRDVSSERASVLLRQSLEQFVAPLLRGDPVEVAWAFGSTRTPLLEALGGISPQWELAPIDFGDEGRLAELVADLQRRGI